MNEMSGFPRRFSVGVMTTTVSGGGHLEIETNAVTCLLGPANVKLSGYSKVTQSKGPFTIYVARLMPPWMNVHLTIRDEFHQIRIGTWRLSLGSLRRSLEAAGFEVVVRHTWFRQGPMPEDFRIS